MACLPSPPYSNWPAVSYWYFKQVMWGKENPSVIWRAKLLWCTQQNSCLTLMEEGSGQSLSLFFFVVIVVGFGFLFGQNAIICCVNISIAFSKTQIESFIRFPWPIYYSGGVCFWCGGHIVPDSLHLFGSQLKSTGAQLQPFVLSRLVSWQVHCE